MPPSSRLLKLDDHFEQIAVQLDGQPPSLQFHDAFGDGQSQTGAFRVARLVASFEAFKQFVRVKLNLVGGDVFHRQHDAVRLFGQRDVDPGVGQRVL